MSETLKENEIRVLAVRQPWASLIVEGLKTIEVRSRPTNLRERIAIYASRTTSSEDFYNVKDLLFQLDYDLLPIGKIIGTVFIDSSTTHPIISQTVYDMYSNEHHYKYRINTHKGVHMWDLKNPIKFSQPIPYKPPTGAVVWSKTVLPEGY